MIDYYSGLLLFLLPSLIAGLFAGTFARAALGGVVAVVMSIVVLIYQYDFGTSWLAWSAVPGLLVTLLIGAVVGVVGFGFKRMARWYTSGPK